MSSFMKDLLKGLDNDFEASGKRDAILYRDALINRDWVHECRVKMALNLIGKKLLRLDEISSWILDHPSENFHRWCFVYKDGRVLFASKMDEFPPARDDIAEAYDALLNKPIKVQVMHEYVL